MTDYGAGLGPSSVMRFHDTVRLVLGAPDALFVPSGLEDVAFANGIDKMWNAPTKLIKLRDNPITPDVRYVAADFVVGQRGDGQTLSSLINDLIAPSMPLFSLFPTVDVVSVQRITPQTAASGQEAVTLQGAADAALATENLQVPWYTALMTQVGKGVLLVAVVGVGIYVYNRSKRS